MKLPKLWVDAEWLTGVFSRTDMFRTFNEFRTEGYILNTAPK